MNQARGTNMEVKRNNRRRVFRYINGQGTVSNPDIAYATKMSLPTVTQITKELLEEGLLEERGELQSTGGRRARALSVAADARLAAGVDITKNHVSFALTNLAGEMLKYHRCARPFAAEDGYWQQTGSMLEAFLEESGACGERMLGVGISFPGIVDLDRQMIAESHILGVKELSFGAVSRFFPYPSVFLNDANAGAYAEGIGGGEPGRFFYLSLSNTVGGALFAEGRLEQGAHFRCGEAGHMTIVPDGERCYCSKRGCLDAYCAARCLSDRTEGKLERFFQGLEQGDEALGAAWDAYTDYLAVAVNNLHMILDCDIVLGGYVGSYVEDYLPGIRDKVALRNTFAGDGGFVRGCRHKVGAATLGAALSVMERFVEEI